MLTKFAREVPEDLVEYTVPAGHVYCRKTGKHVGPGEIAWVPKSWVDTQEATPAAAEAPFGDVPAYDYKTGKAKAAPKRPKARKD